MLSTRHQNTAETHSTSYSKQYDIPNLLQDTTEASWDRTINRAHWYRNHILASRNLYSECLPEPCIKFLPTSMPKSPLIVPGADAKGLVDPIKPLPVLMTSLPSHTMATCNAPQQFFPSLLETFFWKRLAAPTILSKFKTCPFMLLLLMSLKKVHQAPSK